MTIFHFVKNNLVPGPLPWLGVEAGKGPVNEAGSKIHPTKNKDSITLPLPGLRKRLNGC